MRYVVLAYRDRVIEPKLLGREGKSALQHLGDFFEDLVTVDQPQASAEDYHFPMCSSGTGISRHSVLERIELGDGRVSLRHTRPWPSGMYAYLSADHEWLGFDPGVKRLGRGRTAGGVFMKAVESPGEAEVFREIWFGADHNFALETHRELFVTAEGGGNGSPLSINRDEIGEWQLFHYRDPPEEFLPKVAPEPTVEEQAIGTVKEAQTTVSGIPANPRGTVQDAETEMQRPAGLRDAIFRRRGK